MAGLLTSIIGLAPVSPTPAAAQTPVRPILIVGGHANQDEQLEDGADDLGIALGYGPADLSLTAGVELASLDGWNWPGSASGEVSADRIYDHINFLYVAAGNTPVDVVAISQGAPTTRRALHKHPDAQDKVGTYISFSGANAGIPDGFLPDLCERFIDVCREMVWDVYRGDTSWLRCRVNMIWCLGQPDGDPTPGGGANPGPGEIAYYNLYTADDGDASTPPPEDEAQIPYNWSQPLQDAQNRSVQDECPNDSAPHGGWYENPDRIDPVFEELLLDAMRHQPLDVPPSLCENDG